MTSPRFDCHMHTPLCGHALGEPDEYVEAAARAHLDVITFTCHMPMPDRAFGGPGIRMAREQFPAYLNRIERARARGDELGVEVRVGIEAEIFPDAQVVRYVEDFLESHPFDFILGSLHHQVPAYRTWLRENGCHDDDAILRAYFAHLALGAMSGLFHSLSHPDVIRLYGTLRGPFEPERFEPEIRRVLQAASDNGVSLEMNTSGLTKGDFVAHPDPVILRWASEYDIAFTMGSDSHAPESVGQFFDPSVSLMQSSGIRELALFGNGERETFPIGEWPMASPASRGASSS